MSNMLLKMFQILWNAKLIVQKTMPFLIEMEFIKSITDFRYVKKSALSHVSDSCIKESTQVTSLSRQHQCMLNAANLVNQTYCKMGTLKILFKTSATNLNMLALTMPQNRHIIFQKFFIHKCNNLIQWKSVTQVSTIK